jgi:hypothetical protein
MWYGSQIKAKLAVCGVAGAYLERVMHFIAIFQNESGAHVFGVKSEITRTLQ